MPDKSKNDNAETLKLAEFGLGCAKARPYNAVPDVFELAQ
jgi:hypothetical protein